ncbi:hypothetical protein [Maribacter sp. 2308TA10-17]|uniref:hypothetical protein n=1 Tax=Maribacter sp. 2308TA10-17 TaxID=3386276 RepID=UPI0039BCDF1D
MPKPVSKLLGVSSLLFIFISLIIFSCKSDDTSDNPVVILDSDGDGILDEQEVINGTNKNNACDPLQPSGYTGFDNTSSVWLASDCDKDGITNGDELSASTDPYVDQITDTDGDGIVNSAEILAGTNVNDPCDPKQEAGYIGFDVSSTLWSNSDCDLDGFLNGEEIVNSTDPYVDDTVYPTAEFLPKLSDLNLFKGDVANLEFNSTVHEYNLATPLYSDYSYKLRSISLPQDAKMTYNGEGLLEFPDNTIITKTFYYLNDERDPSAGRKRIETRLLIKKAGVWQFGNYLWNTEQDDAILSLEGPTVPVDWIDTTGANRSVNYQVPIMLNCIQCHNSNGVTNPIGPKARNLNFVQDGINSLQKFMDKGLLEGAPNISEIEKLPVWSDLSFSVSERARAYMDVNCAHCHQPGGFHDSSIGVRPDLRYETSFPDSNIEPFKADIRNRVNTDPAFGPSMPLIGVTIKHTEGVQLIHDYIDSL